MNIAVVLILIFLLAAGKNQKTAALGNLPVLVTYVGTSKYYGTDKDWNVAATWPCYQYRSLSNIYDQFSLDEMKEKYGSSCITGNRLNFIEFLIVNGATGTT